MLSDKNDWERSPGTGSSCLLVTAGPAPGPARPGLARPGPTLPPSRRSFPAPPCACLTRRGKVSAEMKRHLFSRLLMAARWDSAPEASKTRPGEPPAG